MNFLQQVLSSVENVAADTLKKELPELLIQASLLRDDVLKYIEEIYIKCISQVNRDNNYVIKVTSLREHAEVLRKHLNELLKDEVTKAKESIVDNKENLTRVEVWLAVCSQLLEITEAKRNILNLINNKEYDKAVIAFKRIDECLNNLSNEEKFDTILSIFSLISSFKGEMKYNLYVIINTNVIMKRKEENDSITYSLTINKNDEVPTAFKALSMFEDNVEPLDELVRFIWDANSLIVNKTMNISVQTENEPKILTLSCSDSNKQKNYYKSIFAQIIVLAEFLFNHLNYELDKHGSVINYISENMRDNLIQLIIKYCLDDTIPDNQEDLQKYQEVIDDTSALQEKLIEIGILTKSTNSILDYAKDINNHYINKKCKLYLLEAENLMKKDLHNTATVGKPFDALNLTSSEFPQCSISKNVLEILEFVQKFLEQSSDNTEVNVKRLLVTANTILQKYAPFVYEYHKTLLQTIPQQLAIFYNNCKYITYDISQPTWNDLHLKLQKSNESSLFHKVGYEIKTFSENIFEEYLSNQINQIETTIKNCGMTASKTCENLPPTVEKSIRQCLRQQELLKTVWQRILNYYDYNKSVGRLLDCLCKSIIESVLYLDDISSDAAENLTEIFKGVQTRGPKIFSDPKEINMFVENWHKFNELLYILNSKLINICDRWADGKGPLALHFKAGEVRTLIRALFQNTDRRDSVLAQIKNV